MLVKVCFSFVCLCNCVYLIRYVTKPVVTAEMMMHISAQLQCDTQLFILWEPQQCVWLQLYIQQQEEPAVLEILIIIYGYHELMTNAVPSKQLATWLCFPFVTREIYPNLRRPLLYSFWSDVFLWHAWRRRNITVFNTDMYILVSLCNNEPLLLHTTLSVCYLQPSATICWPNLELPLPNTLPCSSCSTPFLVWTTFISDGDCLIWL